MTLFDKSQAAKVPWGTALLTVSTIVLAFIFSARWNRPISQWPIDLPLYRYTFTAHPELHDFDDPAAKDLWGDMVYHDWWATDWRDDTGRRFTRGIDIFHKMHCLVAIREEFVKLATEEQRMGGHDGMAYEVDANGKKVPLVWNQDHLEHCFDFLRQDILCAADMTLEPLGPEYVQTSGWGVEHECKDWRKLLDHVGLSNFDEV